MPKLTPEQRVFLIKHFYQKGPNPNRVVLDLFQAKFLYRPSEKAMTNLVEKFETEYTIEDRKRTKQHPATSEANQELVLASVAEDPNISIRKQAQIVGISASSVGRILKLHKFHPYKMQVHQKLNEDDPDRRMQFCQDMMDRANENEYFIRSICFSDEATCFLNGEVNRQTFRYWSQENPHWMEGIKAQGLDKVSSRKIVNHSLFLRLCANLYCTAMLFTS
jgi:hypothetical protein